jgi:phosphoribosylaminoimidazole-succinocarboxamide synthase
LSKLLLARLVGPQGGHNEEVGATGVGLSLESLSFDLPGHTSGKVRESWSLPGGHRLLVTTDRLSAFDRVIGLVPHKGQVLNQLAAWWFDRTSDIVANHVVSVPDPMALIAVDASPLPVEVVVRGRLTGSTSTSVLPRYLAGERVLYGHTFPDGLAPHGPLPEPLITPTTNAAAGGHDSPITVNEVVASGLLDAELWTRVQRVALDLFTRGVEIAAAAGFVLADTKYEFGLGPSGELLLIDEVHTPDSSRYWSVEGLDARLADGKAPEGFDKEPVRLARGAAGYGGDGPPPELPDEVWTQTSRRYIELYERLTGTVFEPGARPVDERLRANIANYLEPTEQ